MTDRAKIEALLARVEAAQEPSRELDAEILVALGVLTPIEVSGYPSGKAFNRPDVGPTYIATLLDGWEWSDFNAVDGYWHDVDPITECIDAAVALVQRELPGWRISLYEATNGKLWGAGVYGPQSQDCKANAATPALALCAVLLRAKLETVDD